MRSDIKKQKSDWLRVGFILFTICAVTSLLLAVAHYFTSPVIQAAAEMRLNDSLGELIVDAAEFSPAENFEKTVVVNGTKVPVREVYIAKNENGTTIGYCVEVAPSGYSSQIELLVALDAERIVTGTRILSISDTPGVGMKVKTDENLHNSVIGLADIVKIVRTAPASKNEVEVISGASISSGAFINGVNAAIETVQDLK